MVVSRCRFLFAVCSSCIFEVKSTRLFISLATHTEAMTAQCGKYWKRKIFNQLIDLKIHLKFWYFIWIEWSISAYEGTRKKIFRATASAKRQNPAEVKVWLPEYPFLELKKDFRSKSKASAESAKSQPSLNIQSTLSIYLRKKIIFTPTKHESFSLDEYEQVLVSFHR